MGYTKKQLQEMAEQKLINNLDSVDMPTLPTSPTSDTSTKPSKSQEPEKRTLEIVTCTGTIIHIEVEQSWKVTFGRLQADFNHMSHGTKQSNGLALRIYRTKEHQLACFRDVESFRDISIPMHIIHSPKKGNGSDENVDDKNAGSKNAKFKDLSLAF